MAPRVPLLVLAYIGFVAAVGAGAVVANHFDRPLTHITRDPLAISETPPYVGALSNLGVLLWWSAAVGCGFAAAATTFAKSRRPLQAAAVFSAVLALDDLYMVHENVLPQVSARLELAVYVGYATAALILLVRSRDFVRQHGSAVLVTALALFAGSLFIDVGSEYGLGTYDAIEDSLKLLGIVTWTTFWLRAAGKAAHGVRTLSPT